MLIYYCDFASDEVVIKNYLLTYIMHGFNIGSDVVHGFNLVTACL